VPPVLWRPTCRAGTCLSSSWGSSQVGITRFARFREVVRSGNTRRGLLKTGGGYSRTGVARSLGLKYPKNVWNRYEVGLRMCSSNPAPCRGTVKPMCGLPGGAPQGNTRYESARPVCRSYVGRVPNPGPTAVESSETKTSPQPSSAPYPVAFGQLVRYAFGRTPQAGPAAVESSETKTSPQPSSAPLSISLLKGQR
jgi:hypothetical protein